MRIYLSHSAKTAGSALLRHIAQTLELQGHSISFPPTAAEADMSIGRTRSLAVSDSDAMVALFDQTENSGVDPLLMWDLGCGQPRYIPVIAFARNGRIDSQVTPFVACVVSRLEELKQAVALVGEAVEHIDREGFDAIMQRVCTIGHQA